MAAKLSEILLNSDRDSRTENGRANAKRPYRVAADLLAGWRDDLLTGKAPVLFPIRRTGELARLEIGPGLVTLLGGAPSAGKSAFAMQATIDALRLTPSLRAVVCSVEMPPAVLLDRQLARLSGIDLGTIRYRQLGADHAERIDRAMDTLEPLAERLAFVLFSGFRRRGSTGTDAAPLMRRWITFGNSRIPDLPLFVSLPWPVPRTPRGVLPTLLIR
jgi:hypothetical protein